MTDLRWGWRTAASGSIAVLLLLLFPFRIPPGDPLFQAFGSMAHVLLFAGLALLWGLCLPQWARGLLLWSGLALLAALMEWTQPWMGRSAEGTDWLFGAAGAACICSTAWMRFRPGLRWVLLITLCLLPLGWISGLQLLERRAFPLLLDPAAGWARYGWTLNGVSLSSFDPESLRVEMLPRREGEDPAAYPGLFRSASHPDWSHAHSFQTELFWPASTPAIFAVRMDDHRGNPPYAERFQKEFAVTQGWNSVWIAADELRQTSGGAPLHLEHMAQWGVFLVSDTPFDYFLLAAVRLELQQEEP